MKKYKLLILWIIAFAMIIPVFIIVFLQIIFCQKRALKFIVAQDQALNTVFGGSEDETVSSRTGRGIIEGKDWALNLSVLIDWFFGKNHCINSIERFCSDKKL